MNTSVTPPALAAALLCFAAPSLNGQDTLTRKTPQPTETVISVHYDGGTLAGFLALVREEHPDANIVASPAAEDVEMPELKIKNATVFSALRAVAAIAPSEYQVTVELQVSGTAEPVHAVRVRPVVSMTAGAVGMVVSPTSVSVNVYSLKNMTDKLPGLPDDESLTIKAETILMALDTGLGVGDGEVRAAVRYHEASGLLFVRGTRNQLTLVQSTVRSLEQDLRHRRDLARQNPANKK